MQSVLRHADAPARQPAPHKHNPPGAGPIRAAVVGLGRAGAALHCRSLNEHPAYELVAVADTRPDVAREIAGKYGCEYHPSAHELFDRAEVDLAVLAVPTCDHAPLALEAVARGIPVLVEKPFAPSSAAAREIFAAGEREGVPVLAYHNRRFDPDVLALEKILDSGVLGEIVKVSIHLHSFVRRRDWQTLRAMGGGALANWGAHAIDWCVRLFGPGLALESAAMFQVLNPGDAEDSFLLQLSHRKTSISIEYLNCAAQPLPKWHVVGARGSAVSHDNTFVVRHCDPARLTPLQADPSAASDGSYGIQEDLGWSDKIVEWDHWDNCPRFLDALFAHLRHGAGPPVSPREVIAQLRLMEQIRERAQIRDFSVRAERDSYHASQGAEGV